MSPEQEDFQQLRRLLALKRHEQPPPGYFNHFSVQVIAQIRAGQRLEKEPLLARLFWEMPALQRVWGALQTKPSLAGAFGCVVCGLLISVAMYSEHAEPGRIALVPATEDPGQSEPSIMAAGMPASSASGIELSSMTTVSDAPRSDSLFEEIRRAPAWRLQPGFQARPELVNERVLISP